MKNYFLIVVFLVISIISKAGIIIPPTDMIDFVRSTNTVVYGEIIAHHEGNSFVNEFRVLDAIKSDGLTKDQIILIEEYSSQIGDNISRISGDVDFEIGKKYILFLDEKSPNRYRLSLMALSAYEEGLVNGKNIIAHGNQMLDLCFSGDMKSDFLAAHELESFINGIKDIANNIIQIWQPENHGLYDYSYDTITEGGKTTIRHKAPCPNTQPSHCGTLFDGSAGFTKPTKYEDNNWVVCVAGGASTDASVPGTDELTRLQTAITAMNTMPGVNMTYGGVDNTAMPVDCSGGMGIADNAQNFAGANTNKIFVFFDDPCDEIADPGCGSARTLAFGGHFASTACHTDICGNEWHTASTPFFVFNAGEGICLSENEWIAVLMHEMLHAIGLAHIDPANQALMNPQIGQSAPHNPPTFGITNFDNQCTDWMYNITSASTCAISNGMISNIQCNGTMVQFDITFDVVDGDGTYQLELDGGQVATINGATTGTVMSTVTINAPGGSNTFTIRDDAVFACTHDVTASFPSCDPSEDCAATDGPADFMVNDICSGEMPTISYNSCTYSGLLGDTNAGDPNCTAPEDDHLFVPAINVFDRDPNDAGAIIIGFDDAFNGSTCDPFMLDNAPAGFFDNNTCMPRTVDVFVQLGYDIYCADISGGMVNSTGDYQGTIFDDCDLVVLTITIYPDLSINVTDDGSSCGTPTATLVNNFDNSVCATQMRSTACSADGDDFDFDFGTDASDDGYDGTWIQNAPAGCTFTSTGTITCSNCVAACQAPGAIACSSPTSNSLNLSWTPPASAPNGYNIELSCDNGTTWTTIESSSQVHPWINELHYDNDGGDQDEGVELAGRAGTDLSCYSIYKYNGSNGEVYNGEQTLSGTIDNEGSSGYGAVFFDAIADLGGSIQNGAPDGIALVYNGESTSCDCPGAEEVIQFISYEGSFMATDGPASGMTSVDIGVDEQPAPAVGMSLQLTGCASQYADFTWQEPMAHSRGTLNVGQQIFTAAGSESSITAINLDPCTEYSFRIASNCCDMVSSFVESTSSCTTLPPSVSEVDATPTICDGGDISSLATWQTAVEEDMTNMCLTIIYSTIASGDAGFPSTDLSAITGNHSGADNCAAESQMAFAYQVCDPDKTANSGDETYQLAGTYTLTVNPATQTPDDPTPSGCMVTLVPECANDVMSNPTNAMGGADAANFNTTTGVYTAQSGDVAGSIDVTVTNEFGCDAVTYTLATPACPASCPDVTAVDDSDELCDGDLATEISSWQSDVETNAMNAAAASDGNTGSIVYGTNVASGTTAPNGETADGVHSGADVCADEDQITRAYLLCFGPDAENDNGGDDDVWLLLGTHTLTVNPATQTPDDPTPSGCMVTLVPECANDVMSNPTNAMGGASTSNFNTSTGVYTAQSGDVAGSIDVTVTNEFGCDAVTYTLATPACPASCPDVTAVDDSDELCDGDLATEISSWQSDVETNAMNAAAASDGNTGSIVYGTNVASGTTAPNGETADGVHSGADVCADEDQITRAYLLCFGPDAENDNGGDDDVWLLLGTHTLTVNPATQTPDDPTPSGCMVTLVPECTNDVMSNPTNAMGGASTSNFNTSTGVYTAQSGDLAGSIDVTVTNEFGCDAVTYTLATPACPASCPDVTSVDDSDELCDGDLATEISSWQSDVETNAMNAAAASDGNTGSIVYGTNVASGTTAPNGETADGVHSGADVCADEDQITRAYLLCFGPDAENDNGGDDDVWLLLGTHTLTVNPATQTPDDPTPSGCMVTLVPECTNDVMSNPTNAMGGASTSNFNTSTGVYTAQSGDLAGSIDVTITNEFNCDAVTYTLATPACPAGCELTSVSEEVNCASDGSGDFEIIISWMGVDGSVSLVDASANSVSGDDIASDNNGSTTFSYSAGDSYNITVVDSDGNCAFGPFMGTPDCPTITNIGVNEISGFDPCSCEDPDNVLASNGDVALFHDYVEITDNSGATWSLQSVDSGNVLDASGNPIPLGTTLTGVDINGSPLPANTTQLQLYTNPGVGFCATFVSSNGVDTMSFCNVCHPCFGIPTVGTWAIMLIILLLLIFGIQAIKSVRRVELS